MNRRVLHVISAVSGFFVCTGLIQCSARNGDEPAAALVSPSCRAIMTPCHVASPSAGPAAHCHALAHADVERDCSAVETECVSICREMLDEARPDAAGGVAGENGEGGKGGEGG